MGYYKHLSILIHNTTPVRCEKCETGNLYILEEKGVMWCDHCGFREVTLHGSV